MTQVFLEPSELSYLFATLGVRSAIGVDEQLFPADMSSRQELLRQGFQALQQNGWMMPTAKGQMDLDTSLLIMAATVGDPERVIMTTRYTMGKGQQLFTHYVGGDLVVEQFFTSGKRFCMSHLLDVPTAVRRIQTALAIPRTINWTHAPFALPEPVFVEARRLAEKKDNSCPVYLLNQGVPETAVSLLTNSLKAYYPKGAVALLKTVGDRILAERLVFLFEGAGITWMATYLQPNIATLTLLPINAEQFATSIETYLDDLTAWQLPPAN